MPAKLLIVDDDTDTLRLVGLMLERQGYEVIAANRGKQAIALAKSELPNLVLLDVMMPDMDGLEVTRQLRADGNTADIPIIMFTAKTQLEDKLSGFDVGADDYLTKPTQSRELFAHIESVLTRASKTQELKPTRARGTIIAVLSAKGGLGVTTLALNLGIAIKHQTKKEVIVAEFRPGQGTLSLELGYHKPDGYNSLLGRRVEQLYSKMVETELVSHDCGIRLLMSSIYARDSVYLQAINHFEIITRHLASLADFTLLDLGPGLTPLAQKILRMSDQVIVVVEPIPMTVTRTKVLLQDLISTGFDIGRVKAVQINRLSSDAQLTKTQVQEQIGHELTMAFTPAPEIAYQASAYNNPIVLQQPDSPTTSQFLELANNITRPST